MKDSSCLSGGCPYSSGGEGGDCTGTPGVLSAKEIRDIIANDRATVTFDQDAAVKIATWNSNQQWQWVSYDDRDSQN